MTTKIRVTAVPVSGDAGGEIRLGDYDSLAEVIPTDGASGRTVLLTAVNNGARYLLARRSNLYWTVEAISVQGSYLMRYEKVEV